MWVNEHPYLFIYLLGSALVLILSVFNMAFFSFIAWMTKENVLMKNLKKLQPPDEETLPMKVLTLAIGLVLEMALSWIGVIAGLWKTLSTLLKVLRESLTSVPEAVRVLRFPLRNNPRMTREAVWAYAHALNVRAGDQQPGEKELRWSLEGMLENNPSFNFKVALQHLRDLGAVDAEVISAALQQLASRSEE